MAAAAAVYEAEGGLERENEAGRESEGGAWGGDPGLLLIEFVSDSVLDLRALAIEVARGL